LALAPESAIITGTYKAVDLGLEASFLAGVLGGYVTGLLSGILISVPAMLFAGEYLSMPWLAGVGVLGGLLRDLAPEPEDIWRFLTHPRSQIAKTRRISSHLSCSGVVSRNCSGGAPFSSSASRFIVRTLFASRNTLLGHRRRLHQYCFSRLHYR